MTGMGTVMNVAGILAGGLGGLAVGKKLEKRYQDNLMNANGICVPFLGIGGGGGNKTGGGGERVKPPSARWGGPRNMIRPASVPTTGGIRL